MGVMIRLGLGVRSSLGAGEAKLLVPLRIMRLEYSRLVGLKVAARNVRFGSRRRSVHECCACALSLLAFDPPGAFVCLPSHPISQIAHLEP